MSQAVNIPNPFLNQTLASHGGAKYLGMSDPVCMMKHQCYGMGETWGCGQSEARVAWGEDGQGHGKTWTKTTFLYSFLIHSPQPLQGETVRRSKITFGGFTNWHLLTTLIWLWCIVCRDPPPGSSTLKNKLKELKISLSPICCSTDVSFLYPKPNEFILSLRERH